VKLAVKIFSFQAIVAFCGEFFVCKQTSISLHSLSFPLQTANMKNIAVFGASGVTGTHFVEKAISNGWNVRCLARSALKERAGQTVVIGQVMDANDVKRTLFDEDGKPVDAVVIALGHNRTSKSNPWSSPTTPVNLIEIAMKHKLHP
jgi:putative NADH-flavin reductase